MSHADTSLDDAHRWTNKTVPLSSDDTKLPCHVSSRPRYPLLLRQLFFFFPTLQTSYPTNKAAERKKVNRSEALLQGAQSEFVAFTPSLSLHDRSLNTRAHAKTRIRRKKRNGETNKCEEEESSSLPPFASCVLAVKCIRVLNIADNALQRGEGSSCFCVAVNQTAVACLEKVLMKNYRPRWLQWFKIESPAGEQFNKMKLRRSHIPATRSLS